MFARLTIYENVDLALADRVRDFMAATETDPFAGLPGYRGSMTLVDRVSARLVGIGLYDSAGEAAEADAMLAAVYEEARTQVPEDLRAALDMQPDTVGVYEVVEGA